MKIEKNNFIFIFDSCYPFKASEDILVLRNGCGDVYLCTSHDCQCNSVACGVVPLASRYMRLPIGSLKIKLNKCISVK